MKDDNSYSGAHLLIAFLAGAAAGATVALLAAPQSGSATRTSIAGWARDVQSKAGRIPGAVTEAYDRAARSAKEAFVEAWNRERPAEEEEAPSATRSGEPQPA